MVAEKQKLQDASTSPAPPFTSGSTPPTHWRAENRVPENPDCLTQPHWAEHVKAYPDQTLDERARYFGVSKSYVAYGLTRLGYTRKKRLDIRSNVQKNGQLIRSNSQRSRASGKTLVYLDETGFQDETFRNYGYAPGAMCTGTDIKPAHPHHYLDSRTT